MPLPRISSQATALTATLVVLFGVAVFADRFGAPAAVVEPAAAILAVAALVLAGVLSRTMRPSTFHMARRRLGWLRSVSMASAAAIGLMLLISQSAPYQSATRIAAGLLIAAVLYAAPMHRAGAPGLGGFALARYRSRLLCMLAGTATALACAAIAMMAASEAMEVIGQLLPGASHWPMMMLLLACGAMIVPGGIVSIAGASVIAMMVISSGYGLPLAILVARLDTVSSFASADTATRLAEMPFDAVTAVAAAGLFAMLRLAVPTPDPVRSRETFAIAALTVLGAAAIATVVMIAGALSTASLGEQPVEALPPAIYAPASRGLVSICGVEPTTQEGLLRACAGRLKDGVVPAAEITVRRPQARWLAIILDLPLIVGALHMLAPALALIVLMSTALNAAGAALVGEVLYPLTNRSGTASGRLALQRLVAIGLLLGVLTAPGDALLKGLTLPSQDGLSALPPQMILLAGVVLVPLALVLPARFRSVDWRTPSLVLAAGLAIGAAERLALIDRDAVTGSIALMALLAVMLFGLLVFRSRDPFDARAADIVAGRRNGPIVRYADP